MDSFIKYILALLVLSSSAFSEDIEYVEVQLKSELYHVNYHVNDDYTVDKVTEIRMRALTDSAAKSLKKKRYSYSTSIESISVIEAYTLKADGKKIKVPENNYQVSINKGKGDGGPIFSDRTRVSIVFPELEKDDAIYLKTKLTEKEPMFPGSFAESQEFYNQAAYDDVQITLEIPEKIDFIYESRGMQKKLKKKEGKKRLTFSYKNLKPIKDKRKNFSVVGVDEGVGFSISTFKDYESIAKAYGARATPKSIPTDRVNALAKEIVDGEKDKKTKAKLLYEWVATNISYAGNCIGVGAVVPHDTDFILDNRMGDCKDHATLLEALYRAEGIKSTQALINVGSRYELAKVPLVSSVNHVINYIPEWDLFLDSTSDSIPFESLAFSISDKPVLLVENHIEGKRTPKTLSKNSYQKVDAKFKVISDGSAEGEINVTMHGVPAIGTRSGWRNVTKEQEKEWLKNIFSSKNEIGYGEITMDDPKPLLPNLSYAVQFKKPEFILSKGAGGFYIHVPMPTALPIYSFLSYQNEDLGDYDIACGNGESIENIEIEFPQGMKILAKPTNFNIKENYIDFKSIYVLKDNLLQVTRSVKDTTPGNVCSGEFINTQQKTLKKIAESLDMQVVYQH